MLLTSVFRYIARVGCTTLVFSSGLACAQAGGLDKTFGKEGLFEANVNSVNPQQAFDDFAVARYLAQ